MKKFITVLSFTFFLLISSAVLGQESETNTPKPSLNNGTIESQFDYLYRKSSTYQEFKVVKQTFYYKIKKNVLDSLKLLKKELAYTKQVVTAQNNDVHDIKEALKNTNEHLHKLNKEKKDNN